MEMQFILLFMLKILLPTSCVFLFCLLNAFLKLVIFQCFKKQTSMRVNAEYVFKEYCLPESLLKMKHSLRTLSILYPEGLKALF